MKTTHAELPEKHNSESTPSEVLKFFLSYTTHDISIYIIVFPEWVYRNDNNLELRSFKAAIDAWLTQESQSPRLIHAAATNTPTTSDHTMEWHAFLSVI